MKHPRMVLHVLHGMVGQRDADHRLDVIHAWLWLLEELPANRFRILTQDRQIGNPAAELAGTSIMIDGHQSWLYSLIKVAQERLDY